MTSFWLRTSSRSTTRTTPGRLALRKPETRSFVRDVPCLPSLGCRPPPVPRPASVRSGRAPLHPHDPGPAPSPSPAGPLPFPSARAHPRVSVSRATRHDPWAPHLAPTTLRVPASRTRWEPVSRGTGRSFARGASERLSVHSVGGSTLPTRRRTPPLLPRRAEGRFPVPRERHSDTLAPPHPLPTRDVYGSIRRA